MFKLNILLCVAAATLLMPVAGIADTGTLTDRNAGGSAAPLPYLSNDVVDAIVGLPGGTPAFLATESNGKSCLFFAFSSRI